MIIDLTVENGLIALSEGQVCYDLAGPDDGETVVFVHGLMGNKTMWTPLYQMVADKGYRVLRFDLYGRGSSDKPHIEYNLPLFIVQIMELVESLEITSPFHIVGLSLGALISTAFTAELPEFVQDVVLLSPAGVGVGIGRMLELAKTPGVGEVLTKAISQKPLIDAAVKRLAAESKQDEVIAAIEENVKDPAYRNAVLSTIRNIDVEHGEEHYTVLGRSTQPILVLWGEKDRLVPYKYAEKIKELMPAAILKFYPGVGHMPNTECPDLVFTDILTHWGNSS